MKLNLTKPLVVFDLETTGLNVSKDRIIQLSYIKVYPDGKEERENIFINPEMRIPKLVTELTGISDDDVKGAPTFKELAPGLNEKFKGCDFAGFNSNRFDVPMLVEEFMRARIDFDLTDSRLIDVQNIYHKMEPRNLAAAYKFYTGHKMEDDLQAHRADQDTEATYRVLQGELDMYDPAKAEDPKRALPNDMDTLAEFSRMNDNVDLAGRIVWADVKDADGNPVLDGNGKPKRQEVFNFSKHKGEAVADVLRKEPGFFSWMMNGDFPQETKQVLTRIKMREDKKNGLYK